MPLHILILYGTTEGQTRKIAGALAETLREEGAEVDVRRGHAPSTDPAPADYDAVIVAASVHAGGYQHGVRQWVKAHGHDLSSRPTAFVSVCLGVLEHDPRTDDTLAQIIADFLTSARWQPMVTTTVAGALPYTKYNWLKRWLMRRIVAKAKGDTDTSRDYEYTDWNQVRGFAREFLQLVRRARPLAAAG